MANVKKRYFKLGKNAASYNHSGSPLNIRGTEVVSIDSDLLLPGDKLLETALNKGHIVELEKAPVGVKITKLPAEDVSAYTPPKKTKADIDILDEEDEEDEEEDDEEDDEEDEEDDEEDDPKKGGKK